MITPADNRIVLSEERSCIHEATQLYSLFGLTVESDLPLPVLPCGATCREPMWRFRSCEAWQSPRDSVLEGKLTLHGTDLAIRYKSGADDWIWNYGAGVFHIRWEQRLVDVYLEPEADVQRAGLILAGQVAVLILRRMGIPALHASAVATAHGAVAFLGTHGQGKSTMAASFIQRGAALLTDDALPLRLEGETVFGGPALPIMKVWEDTVRHNLEVAEELPAVMQGLTKRLLRLGDDPRFLADSVPLRALYLLYRYDAEAAGRSDVMVVDLGPREALVALSEQTSGRVLMSPREQAGLFPFYSRLIRSLPVRTLMYPHGYEHQEKTCRAVLEEISRS